MNPDPITLYRHGVRELAEVCLLILCGRCGTAGITGVLAGEAMRIPAGTVYQSYGRLVEAGLVHPPSRDTRQGRPNRYVITPAGLALLQLREPVKLPAQQEVMQTL